MKKTISIIAILALVVGINVSCKKKPTEFDIDYTNTVTIPASSITVNVPANFESPEIPTESKEKFSSKKTLKDYVEEIKMTRFNLSVDNGNLDFLKSLSIYIKASNQPDVLVATKTVIPQGVSSFAMDLEDLNIKEYIFNETIKFKVNVTIQSGMANTAQLKMDQTVHVKAKIVK
jgi:hypothetical protein